MKSIITMIVACVLVGCSSTPELEYRSEKENQLTRGEELVYTRIARSYAKENHAAYKISKQEIMEIEILAPQIRSYCEAYKYGDISVAWVLRSGSVITVASRGQLNDPNTKMSIKIMRVGGITKKKALTLREQLKMKKK